ncbi:MAG: PBP1A family penicillin-binding protein, partial [Elusimicrobia bacterium]|nr:PBP1A family penicillin-binding protein [Elusimicrobiota bacterium]MBD3411646.1 PBP1A family penicillin-binding protein [Elusimicrobiota bacterium]
MQRKTFYILWLLIIIMVVSGTYQVRRFLSDLPDITYLDTYIPSLVTKIYDRNNQLIAELFTEKRTLIPLSRLPVDLQNAIIATEDTQFFSHWGINPKAILRAFIKNTLAGRVVEGGSTITQQLAKVLFLTRERTLARKIKELILSLQLEYYFTKEEILQLYLNQIYFGHGAYGVEAAAKWYFEKHVQELSLSECAYLAGLPRAPNRYSLFRNPDLAIKRRAVVLRRMREMGFISPLEEQEANKVPIRSERPDVKDDPAAYFVEYVRLLLEPTYGSDMIYRGGLSVYTTMDLDMQMIAKHEYDAYCAELDQRFVAQKLKEREEEGLSEEELSALPEISTHTFRIQGAFISLNVRTGGILAMIGGRDFKQTQFNRAVQAMRQPGSTFKPFIWMAALQEGMTASTIIDDMPVVFYMDRKAGTMIQDSPQAYDIIFSSSSWEKGSIWVPQNYDYRYLGPITLRQGLEQSRNLVSVRLAHMVDPRKAGSIAHALGIKSPLEGVLSLSLGTSVVNLLELTSAFSTLANSGIYVEPYAITRVEDSEGRILEENIPFEREVFPAVDSYLIVNLLQGVITRGTGRRARIIRRPAAGKTGTSQEWRDLWFIGFTPEIAGGVWLGYDDFTTIGSGKHVSSGMAVQLWTNIMRR